MISVLRLGHRIPRDERITTHVALVARAFGAEKIVYSGQKDHGLEESIEKTVNEWGGNFSIEYIENGIRFAKEMKKKECLIVHLTMYGMPVAKKIKKIRKSLEKKDVLVVVGGSQVPAEFYHISDYNISIGLQPHSEVAALGLFLHEYFEGKELEKEFKGKKKILPSENKKLFKYY